ncbi:MAG: FAD synthase [Methanomassiliicoccales archaeon PtaU1.Bin124]|nr:MAG: FAD synthase [Methanomassiliicoccales archaeon PtaU1.Bin124]
MTRVMASGVFDIVHAGHLRYLQEARELGDELVVVVATDNTVRRRKHEPVMPEKMRLELVQGLKPVDKAFLGREGNFMDIVLEIRPDIIALGYDQEFDEKRITDELASRGLKVRVVRLSKHEDDLNGTRKIITRIIDWYSTNKSEVQK